jgi:hypothetical protein
MQAMPDIHKAAVEDLICWLEKYWLKDFKNKWGRAGDATDSQVDALNSAARFAYELFIATEDAFRKLGGDLNKGIKGKPNKWLKPIREIVASTGSKLSDSAEKVLAKAMSDLVNIKVLRHDSTHSLTASIEYQKKLCLKFPEQFVAVIRIFLDFKKANEVCHRLLENFESEPPEGCAWIRLWRSMSEIEDPERQELLLESLDTVGHISEFRKTNREASYSEIVDRMRRNFPPPNRVEVVLYEVKNAIASTATPEIGLLFSSDLFQTVLERGKEKLIKNLRVIRLHCSKSGTEDQQFIVKFEQVQKPDEEPEQLGSAECTGIQGVLDELGQICNSNPELNSAGWVLQLIVSPEIAHEFLKVANVDEFRQYVSVVVATPRTRGSSERVLKKLEARNRGGVVPMPCDGNTFPFEGITERDMRIKTRKDEDQTSHLFATDSVWCEDNQCQWADFFAHFPFNLFVLCLSADPSSEWPISFEPGMDTDICALLGELEDRQGLGDDVSRVFWQDTRYEPQRGDQPRARSMN